MAAVPVTPRKRDNQVEQVIQQLNADYNLGIDIPDNTLTPARRKQRAEEDEAFGRCDSICRGLQFLYYQPDGSLNQAMHSFFIEAKAVSQRWVPKPRADPDTLPSSTTPPRAQTAGQQWQLQTILEEVLVNFKSIRTPTTLSTRSSSALATYSERAGTPTPAPTAPYVRPKRPSHDGTDVSPPKRVKGKQTDNTPPVPIACALDSVPTRRRAGQEPARQELRQSFADRRRQAPDHSSSHDTSSNSSKSSLAASVFSETDQPHLTQSSLEALSQEKKTIHIDITEEGAPSEESFPVSSTELYVMNESFARYEFQRRESPAPAVKEESRPPPSPPSPSTIYSSIEGAGDIPMPDPDPRRLTTSPPTHKSVLDQRLEDIWPMFPRWIHNAPLVVAWEITRICLHCGVKPETINVQYNPAWTTGINEIWKSLRELDPFRGKSFPERPSAEAFSAALTNFETRGSIVILSASLDFNTARDGPLFLLDMKPVKLDQGCRLTRRFGSDRFLEVLIPSPTGLNVPAIVKSDGGAERVIEWLTKPHSIVGRNWQAFYTKDAGYRKPAKELRLGPDAKPTWKDRVHFFAESGYDIRPVVIKSRHHVPAINEPIHARTEFKVSQMLDWLLQLKQNEWQPHLKLFSRIQLGLSKTCPVIVFEPHQMRHHKQDILSPIGKVMNDGIGRMSRSVARKIRDVLGLSDIPSAIQGRMGPAKGMWLMDVRDADDEDWIETHASELKPAGLNLQFLPVLEAQAKDPALMRQAIGERLTNDLQRQFDTQKEALKRPIQFRQWISEISSGRSNRVKFGHVPFLGGLPESREEIVSFLLNSGFDPTKQKYLQELAWDLQKQKCDELKTKLNIKVGRSAYVYMVVDFWGVLEENEVHIGFSSKFRDDVEDFSYTLLTDCDVLVARSPAHFVSDVQKVRAVFKPELHALKDVIVFPTKGNIALADKLSGGDYDGDLAWVCWDPDIVRGFQNADVPPPPDLDRYISKDKTTFGELVKATRLPGHKGREAAAYEMITKSFHFAMQPNFLGICTNYKERLCYHQNSVSNDAAIILSSLVGNLVDQSKQGIKFGSAKWEQLRKEQFRGRMFFEDPAYKGDVWRGKGEPQHIIDFLKFSIAKPAIDRELAALHKTMQANNRSGPGATKEEGAHPWDPDLAEYYEHFKSISIESKSCRVLLEGLKCAIEVVQEEWKRSMRPGGDGDFHQKVNQLHAKWQDIKPDGILNKKGSKIDSKMVKLLEQSFLPDPETSYWALLKASVAFKIYFNTNRKFVWQMAGRQLAMMKAQMTLRDGGAPCLVTPLMYAGLGPDKKFVKQYVARLDGEGSEYPEEAGFVGDDDDLEGYYD
ncbi:putative RNA-dependent RNA polymerase SHL2 [Diplogelasinospora grovesii]|uniref:RNA-dependent RNA polymerase n=1 Tax=Diplogelasinospora grovesii TaxID=303347 RepID=A0AAN6RY77_9PEZI|nr:putative RNA-dependent RNA polymerase SHL2 [Diplogelasinospora grovesii]